MREETQAATGSGTETTTGALHQQVLGVLNDVLLLDLPPQTGDLDRAQVTQWDSVNHLRLVLELEQVFSVALSDDDVVGMQSVEQIEAMLRRHGIGDGGTTQA